MFGAAQIARMRPGTHLINASRGSVVDIDALAGALRSGHLAGAAVDVFPSEPKGNEDPFESPLLGLDNVILTPHVGGSTLEAQDNIGVEVAAKLVRYSDNGSTLRSEAHTSELQSLMRISYAVFCLKKQTNKK